MHTSEDLRPQLEQAVQTATEAGYYRDLLLHTVRRFGSDVRALCAAVIDGRPLPPVRESTPQLLLFALTGLRPVPRQTAGLTDSESGDQKIVSKVRALLAKAEATSFPEEAEAFMAKAQELIARHAIDEVVVAGGTAHAADVACRHVLLEEPYLRPKYLLLARVARANRCRAIQRGDFAMVFGSTGDLEAVELLYTSLLAQATSSMLSAGTEGHTRSRSFRHGFLVAFAERIGQRLEEANTAVVEEDTADAKTALPALLERDRAAEQMVEELFPNVRSMSISSSNPAGLSAGYAAANRASLGGKAMRQSPSALPSG
jgi:hypothetical protein